MGRRSAYPCCNCNCVHLISLSKFWKLGQIIYSANARMIIIHAGWFPGRDLLFTHELIQTKVEEQLLMRIFPAQQEGSEVFCDTKCGWRKRWVIEIIRIQKLDLSFFEGSPLSAAREPPIYNGWVGPWRRAGLIILFTNHTKTFLIIFFWIIASSAPFINKSWKMKELWRRGEGGGEGEGGTFDIF